METMRRPLRQLFLVSILSLLCDFGQSADVLAIFSFPGVSAFHYNKGIVESLLEVGHRVTFLTPFASKMKTTQTNLTVVELGHGLPKLYHRFSSAVLANYTVYERMQFLFSFEEMYVSEIMKTQVIKDALSSKVKFDIMLTQTMFIPQCQLKIAEILQLPVIGTIAFRKEMPMLNTGNPLNPSILSHVLSELGEKMPFSERLANTWYYIVSRFFDATVIRRKAIEFCRQHFPQSPALPQISPSLFFVDSHSSILSRASVPNFIEIAGVHIGAPKPLNSKLQKFVDEAEHGVILFTLSSLVLPSKIPSEMTSVFVEVFASIPQRVVWKYDGVLEHKSENVMLVDWVPQRDILEHKNVIAFISHCGISSLLEAIHTGTPVVAIPLFTDQPSNAKLLEDFGVAVRLPAYALTKEKIRNALNAIVNDTRYYENMQKLSRKFKDRQMTPKQTVVYWTEYVLRHKGAAHLRIAAIDMPLYKYLLLDVIVFVFSVIAAISYIFYFITRLLCRLVCKSHRLKETHKKKE